MPENPLSGPQIGQIVLYNNAGTIVPAMISAVSAAGVATLAYLSAGTWTNVAAAVFNPNLLASTWAYPTAISGL